MASISTSYVLYNYIRGFMLVSLVVAPKSVDALPSIKPDFADLFDNELSSWLDSIIGTDIAVSEYQLMKDKGEMDFGDVDLKDVLATMERGLRDDLDKKVKALERSVLEAEKLAKNHTWNSDPAMQDVIYIHAKEDDPENNETVFVYDERLEQNVIADTSSVHIPVEVFRGDVDIQNGLTWSARLDRVFHENRLNDPDLLWQYFGSRVGFMRTLPASRWHGDSVDLYDVRRRPWYTLGSSPSKDMLILIDHSGSVHGKPLQLLKVAAKSIINTLGENDYIRVAKFSKETVGLSCLNSFVRANHRNKKLLFDEIDEIVASKMASYEKAFDFGYKEFEQLGNSSVYADHAAGAKCNKVMVMLTESPRDIPEEVFKKYDWDATDVRVFIYAIGLPTKSAVVKRWMACTKNGFFSQIPAMGEIRTTVQEYIDILQKDTVQTKQAEWTDPYNDAQGLGMTTTVTLPVYDTTDTDGCRERCLAGGSNDSCAAGCSQNQTIIGVMGIDFRTKDMQKFTPLRKLGPNGYSFVINTNGYLVSHPHLKYDAVDSDSVPPNVDIMDVEIDDENGQKSSIRKKMIDQKSMGSDDFDGFFRTTDGAYIAKQARTYMHAGIAGSPFSIGVVNPKSHTKFLEVSKPVAADRKTAAMNQLNGNRSSLLLLAPWNYCPGLADVIENNVLNSADILKDELDRHANGTCGGANGSEILNNVLLDLSTTKLQTHWEETTEKAISAGIIARFIGTYGGLTAVFPWNEGSEFLDWADVWNAAYFQRAFMYEDENQGGFVFSVRPVEPSNYSVPFNGTVLVAKSVKLSNQVKVAVVGAKITEDELRNRLAETVDECKEIDVVCYLLDESGYLIASNQPDYEVGRFIGDPTVDPQLAYWMYNTSLIGSMTYYDYQATCTVITDENSASGPRSFYIPTLTDLFNWLTPRFSATYFIATIFELVSDLLSYASADDADDESVLDDKIKNISCTMKREYYYANTSYLDSLPGRQASGEFNCFTNCTRRFLVKSLEKSNLLLVVADQICDSEDSAESCEVELPGPSPVTDDGPDICAQTPRYRRRESACMNSPPRRKTIPCRANCLLKPLNFLIISLISIAMFVSHPF
ncbi:voltage-dependent calcium channel subunit alpha-2/delta-1-like [Tubulanus polymorphus]|uniref:voltage-dependent calcium channel subunit alpha-2/delta-1-like n=1 Tax=Tubulanus polymorphus TaxID=672921 RepID=UPI003DA4D7F2